MLRKALGWTIGTECSKRDTVHDMLTKFRALNIEKLGSLPSSVSNVYDHFSRSSIPCRRFLLDDEKMSAFAMSESVSTRAWTPDRSYQREALQSVVSQDEKSIRSCILKICCGGGKTPVAVAIVSNSRMRTIVLTTGSVSCQQWKEHFVKFADMREEDICVIGDDDYTTASRMRHAFAYLPSVVVATYNIMSLSSSRQADNTNLIVKLIRSMAFGLAVFDEIQSLPAKTFRSVLHGEEGEQRLIYASAVGLSATLMREDDGVQLLLDAIGPVVMNVRYADLAREGHVARIERTVVNVPHPASMDLERMTDVHVKQMAVCVNPYKMHVLSAIVDRHVRRKDERSKIIVFVDNVASLPTITRCIEKTLGTRATLIGPVHMQTPSASRLAFLHQFESEESSSVIVTTRVMDAAVNTPTANVSIVVANLSGSRNVEAQRVGRIQRPKPGKNVAYAYTLSSSDTFEARFFDHRNEFMEDEGYSEVCLIRTFNTTAEFFACCNAEDGTDFVPLVETEAEEMGSAISESILEYARHKHEEGAVADADKNDVVTEETRRRRDTEKKQKNLKKFKTSWKG